MEEPLADAQRHRVARELLAEALEQRDSVWFPLQGECMLPLLRAGDRVEVRPGTAVRVGSLVLARRRTGELVCHRVLSLKAGVLGASLQLAGDRSLTAEDHPPESLLGVVHTARRGAAQRRLDGRWAGLLNRLQAALHRVSLRFKGTAAGRLAEAPRRALLVLRGYGWCFAGSDGRSLLASCVSKSGVWLRGPASSR